MEVVGTNLGTENMSKCEEHGHELVKYCRTHHATCCKDCVQQEHSECETVITLAEAVSKECSDEGIRDITTGLEDLMLQFDTARGAERESMRTVDSQGKDLEKRVKKFRKNVEQMLDKLEISVLQKKDEICGEEKGILRKRVDVCDLAINNIKDSLLKMKTIKKGPAEERTVVQASRMMHMNDKYRGVLDDLTDGRGKFSLTFQPSQQLVTSLDSLGSINVKSTIKPMELEGGDTDMRLVKTSEIGITCPLDTGKCTITGCACLPGSILVLADESNTSLKVVKTDSDSGVVMVKKLTYAPWDVTAISDNEVALRSSGSVQEKQDKKVYLFKITSDIQETSVITLDGRPRAIAYHDGHMYVAITKQNESYIKVMTVAGKFKKSIQPKKKILADPQYIEFVPVEKTFYVSDFYKGISAVGMNGDVIFQRVEGAITEYGGVTVDNYGRVFVCAGKPYGIYRVTPDGSSLVPFIKWEDDVDPQALTFCHKNSTFIVTFCNSAKVYVYGYIPCQNGDGLSVTG